MRAQLGVGDGVGLGSGQHGDDPGCFHLLLSRSPNHSDQEARGLHFHHFLTVRERWESWSKFDDSNRGLGLECSWERHVRSCKRDMLKLV